METGRDWDEGVPLALFAVREAVQESLGFSPAELVFGHTVRGPLNVLKEQIVGEVPVKTNVLSYVSRFRERLHGVWEMAKENLSDAQEGMKRYFDKRAVPRSLQAGDKVLILLPVPGASLQARFTGPYSITQKLSDTDYVVDTPDRRKQSRVCHINMLKRYHSRDVIPPVKPTVPSPVAIAVAVLVTGDADESIPERDEDGLSQCEVQRQSPRLCNSEMLQNLPTLMPHLSKEQESDLVQLFSEYSCLFSDVPTRTTVLEHDIDVGEARPIKQHPYRVNSEKRKLMEKEVMYLLENNLAYPSSSAWSSPCLLVPKPDSTVRFCTDYRKVNKITVPD